MEQLLIKSENCMSELERWKKRALIHKTFLIIVEIAITLILLAYMTLGENSDYFSEDKFFVFIKIGALAWLAFNIYKFNKKSNVIMKEYKKIASLCNIETLFVYKDGIKAIHQNQQLTLSFNNIRNVDVKLVPLELEDTYDNFKNNELIIVDLSGNKYTFSIFLNSFEIKNIIEENLPKGTNINNDDANDNEEYTPTHTWKCECGKMISSIPCPYCGIGSPKETKAEEQKQEVPTGFWKCMGCGEIISNDLEKCKCGFKKKNL